MHKKFKTEKEDNLYEKTNEKSSFSTELKSITIPAGATGFDTEEWSSYRIVYQ